MDFIISFIAQYFYAVIVVLAGVYLLWYYRPQLLRLGIAAVFIGGLSYLISKVGNAFIPDPRPFVVSGHAALIHSSTDNGFPSDHTLLIAAIAAVVTLANWKIGIVMTAPNVKTRS